jgi:hypothetical protein
MLRNQVFAVYKALQRRRHVYGVKFAGRIRLKRAEASLNRRPSPLETVKPKTVSQRLEYQARTHHLCHLARMHR